MALTKASLFLIGFYTALFLWWFSSSISKIIIEGFNFKTLLLGIDSFPHNYIFAFLYGLLPLSGGIFGILKSKKWGLFQSAMGKALFYLSTGLIAWGIGELIWSYYNFILHEEIPYPSWADAVFILSYFLWILGIFYLAYATGAKYGLKAKSGTFIVIIIPIVAIILSYFFLIYVARGNKFELSNEALKIFFDLAYPIGDVIILSLALLIYGLSFKYLGGKYKLAVFITLFGFIVNYFADFAFSFTTTTNTFYNGSFVDLLFATAMFVLSFGVNSFDPS